jgi:two-component system cell cycle sensor histidine kinase/response regulator CckA
MAFSRLRGRGAVGRDLLPRACLVPVAAHSAPPTKNKVWSRRRFYPSVVTPYFLPSLVLVTMRCFCYRTNIVMNEPDSQKRMGDLEATNLEMAAMNAELKASEQKYRRLFESMMDAYVSVDMDGHILETNHSYQTMLGYSEAELRSLTYSDLTPEKWHATESRIVKEQVIQLGYSFAYEKEYRRKDGTLFPIELRTFLLRDDSGQPSGMWAIIRDITERKRVETALRRSESLLKEAQNIASAGNYVLDCITGLWSSSDELNTLFGITPAYERSVESWVALIHPDDRTMMNDYFKNEVLGQGKLFNKEYRIIRNDNQAMCWVHGLGRLKYDTQGHPIEMHGVIQNITQRKQSEAALAKLTEQLTQAQKMESVGRLAGGVAHDFNNMLGVILGHVEMAMEQVKKSEPLYSNLEEIRKAAQRSADLTRQLLAFGRKQLIMPEILALNETVTGMLKMLHRLIGENINLVWQPGANLWPVKMDPSQIDQILINLCVNARDAITGIGSVTIETENKLFTEDECAKNIVDIPGEYVLLSVSDSGCGMNKEMLPLLFEPFFTTKDVGKGTGLGLSTVYGIVKQNNGFITVYSEPGHGTTLKIYLPRHAGRREPAVAPKPEQPAQRGSETILLVEDEPTMMTMTTVMLQKQGYTVLPASTPDTALRLARDHADTITLMITDVIMPEMNGRDLARTMRTLHPTLKCLFMSAYTENVITTQGILDPGAQFIQKPFSRNDFTAKVREVLDSK